MARRRRIFFPRQYRLWPALMIGLAILGAFGLLGRGLQTDGLPGCNSEQVRAELANLLAYGRMTVPELKTGERFRLGPLHGVDEKSVQNRLHARTCSGMLVSADGQHEFRFRIVADAGSQSYRIAPVQDRETDT